MLLTALPLAGTVYRATGQTQASLYQKNAKTRLMWIELQCSARSAFACTVA